MGGGDSSAASPASSAAATANSARAIGATGVAAAPGEHSPSPQHTAQEADGDVNRPQGGQGQGQEAGVRSAAAAAAAASAEASQDKREKQREHSAGNGAHRPRSKRLRRGMGSPRPKRSPTADHAFPPSPPLAELKVPAFHPQLFRYNPSVFFNLQPAVLRALGTVVGDVESCVMLGNSLLTASAHRWLFRHGPLPATDPRPTLLISDGILGCVCTCVFARSMPAVLAAIASPAAQLCALVGVAARCPDLALVRGSPEDNLLAHQLEKLFQWLDGLCEPLQREQEAGLDERLLVAIAADVAQTRTATPSSTGSPSARGVQAALLAHLGLIDEASRSSGSPDDATITLLLGPLHSPAPSWCFAEHLAAGREFVWRGRTSRKEHHGRVFDCCGQQVYLSTNTSRAAGGEEAAAPSTVAAAGLKLAGARDTLTPHAPAAALPPTASAAVDARAADAVEAFLTVTLPAAASAAATPPLPAPPLLPHCLRDTWANPLSIHPGELRVTSSSRRPGGTTAPRDRIPRCGRLQWSCCDQDATAEGCQPPWVATAPL